MSLPSSKILVIRGGAIGDFILTLPVLAALRTQFPTAKLELLGYEHIAPLATLGGLADGIRSIESGSLAGYFARGGSLSADLQEYFAQFAIIISYLYDPDLIFQTNVGRSSKAQFIAGPHRPDETGNIPASVSFLKPLERLAIFSPDPVPRLNFDSPQSAGKTSATFTVALHPGSGSERKNWPEAKWSELLRRILRETDWRLLLVGGESEGDRLHRFSAAWPQDRFDLRQNVPLMHLAAHLAGADIFLGHDSGISHLAAALGVPGIILWADSVEGVWRPPSDKIQIVRAPGGIADISVNDVMNHLREAHQQLARTP